MIIPERGSLRPKADWRSDESAAGGPVHRSSGGRIYRDTFQQAGAAGDEEHRQHQHGPDDGDDLLYTTLAGAHLGDVLANRGAAVGAYAAALDDQVSAAMRAFDFGPQRH